MRAAGSGREQTMSRVLIAAIALSLCAAATDAAAKQKHKRKPVLHDGPAAVYVPANHGLYPTRPPWAAPHQCFTDEGYGRFRPCDAGPSSIR
jgi:hypothetical protein